MRLAAVGLVALLGLGCNSVNPCSRTGSVPPWFGMGTEHPAPCEQSTIPEACTRAGTCPAPCPGPKVCEQPKVREVEQPKPKEAQVVERTTGQAAITQDILLIPRTVYVPYAPQVPVAPARLGTVAPAERVLTQLQTTRESVGAPVREAPAPSDRSSEALDKCCQVLQKLDERIRALEQHFQLQPQVVPSVACPAIDLPPCPASPTPPQ
jgi:hypothetical protein